MTKPPVKYLNLPKRKSDFNNRGFTLAEMLIVLLIWSLLAAIVLPLQHQVFTKIETDQYLRQFKLDVLAAQQLTMQNHSYYWIMIREEKNDYYLYDYLHRNTVFHHHFPDNWKLQLTTLPAKIQFSAKGTIKNPGTMFISPPNQSYKVVFPFGRGRMKVIEQ
ncbi:type II secretion system GspH family protein [Halobacillus salinarum]|uniref:Type II secretion system GspH family protein n=1 Tax=Halobacillus salinarum TaxID=2932257 RepID=A0ABY4EDK5_9BACI|nr:competence type IV pilus minor pilin ComGD [Halobacillus salinarum]UOQ42533.1 type II secretion system GspH family protein [Halobacillus salinarum]